MYSSRERLKTVEYKPKVIHLVRDARQNAISYERQRNRYRLRGDAERIKAFNSKWVPIGIDILTLGVLAEQRAMRQFLVDGGYEWIELSYDAMTENGRETKEVPAVYAWMICGFLGVGNRRLRIPIRREFGTEVFEE